jgi:hypothetical protein
MQQILLTLRPYYLLLTTSTETLRKLLLQLIVHIPYYLLLTTSTGSVSVEVVSNK